MTVSERVAAGVASDEEVALLCGWTQADTGRQHSWLSPADTAARMRGGDYTWRTSPPAFTTDIRATMAECSRRGWSFDVGNCGPEGLPWACVTIGPRDYSAETDDITTALLIALTRAIEASK